MLYGVIAMIAAAATWTGGAAALREDHAGLHRWVEFQAGTVALRYRTITSSANVRTTNQVQHSEGVRARLRLDRAARYTINFGASTRNSMTAGWNNTGIGTGEASGYLYLKQLFIAAAPWRGIAFQYGSLSFTRGESTEITTYDNDAYLVGLRGSLARAEALFFDEISLTQGYMLPHAPPSVFDRGSHFQHANYWQALLGKRIGEPLNSSLEYTRALDLDTLRVALTLPASASRLVPTVRIEGYHRLAGLGQRAANGYAAYVERVTVKRLIVGGGWADIDERYGGLNADRFNTGRRLFVTTTISVAPALAVHGFYTLAPAPAFPVPNRTRFELILAWNALKPLERKPGKVALLHRPLR